MPASAALAAALLLSAAAAQAPTLELSREGHVFRVQAGFEASALPATAWAVLTDYDGMTRFVTSLKKSRVAGREDGAVLLEQEGVVRVAMFWRRIPVRLKVFETPPERIDFVSIDDSTFENYEGSWTVAASSAGCLVSYQLFAEMKPSLVPRSLARRILEKSITAQLGQVQAEMERRSGR